MNDQKQELHRQNLIHFVLSHTALIPLDQDHQVPDMAKWCNENVGDQREGDIFQEAREGHLDYFDGDWNMFELQPWDLAPISLVNPSGPIYSWGFFFWNKTARLQFQLCWLGSN